MFAQSSLGLMYQLGRGVPHDEVLALMRYHLAAAQGDDYAKEARDELAAKTVMCGDCWIDEVGTEPPQARERPILVGAGEPAIPDDIRNQDRRELSGLAHCAPPVVGS
jgi:hypothetical protein